MMPGRKSEDFLHHLVLVDRRGNASDPELPRDQDHVLGSTAEVEENRVRLIWLGRVGGNECDRDRGPGDMTGEVSRLGQLFEAVPLAHHHESPSLQVLGAPRPPPRMDDPSDVFAGDRFIRELPNNPDPVDPVPDLHRKDSAPTRLRTLPDMAITGAHVLLYTSEPDALRDVFRDVFGLVHVDAGDGWLIFALPPAELAVHPAEGPTFESGTRHQLTFMCDDITATIGELRSKGIDVRGEPEDEGWGITTTLRLPGGGEVMLYEPRHPTAI